MAAEFSTRKRVRPIAQMNVVPYIDVMLVLLIIFMVTAPMMTSGQIEVPSAGAAARAPDQFVRVSIALNNELTITDSAGNTNSATINELVAQVKALQANNENMAVIIAADKKLPYEQVIAVLNRLQENGIRRTGLLVAK